MKWAEGKHGTVETVVLIANPRSTEPFSYSFISMTREQKRLSKCTPLLASRGYPRTPPYSNAISPTK